MEIIKDGLLRYYNSKRGVSGTSWSNIAPNNVASNITLENAVFANESIIYNGSTSRAIFLPPIEFKTTGHAFTFELSLKASNFNLSELQLLGGSTYLDVSEWGLWHEVYIGDTWDTEIGVSVGGVSMTNNELFQISIVYDPSVGQLRYYQDGILRHTQSSIPPSHFSYGSGTVDIGGSPTFAGELYYVRMYNRALTNSEILNNANVGIEIGLEGSDSPYEPLPPNVLARYSSDGSLHVSGKFIESDRYSPFDLSGNIYAVEFIETEDPIIRFGSDGKIYANKFIEDAKTTRNIIPTILHLNGSEYGVYDFVAPTNSFSNANLGVHNTDYRYDSQETLHYLYSRGWRYIKVPIRWERIQNIIGGELREEEVQLLSGFLDRCHTAGLKVVIDVHNYGVYYQDVGGVGIRTAIGSPELPISAFTDLWRRLVEEYKDHPAVFGYAIMAEPQSEGGLTSGVWQQASQEAVNTIRELDKKSEIHVAGFGWSSTEYWGFYNGNRAWINDDSGGIIRYEAHHYFDKDGSGSYQTSYEDSLADAELSYTAQGNLDALHTKILTELAIYSNWLNNNNALGIIGEMGWTADPRWISLGERYLDELRLLGIPAVAWNAGEWAGDSLSIYQSRNPLNTPLPQAEVWEREINR